MKNSFLHNRIDFILRFVKFSRIEFDAVDLVTLIQKNPQQKLCIYLIQNTRFIRCLLDYYLQKQLKIKPSSYKIIDDSIHYDSLDKSNAISCYLFSHHPNILFRHRSFFRGFLFLLNILLSPHNPYNKVHINILSLKDKHQKRTAHQLQLAHDLAVSSVLGPRLKRKDIIVSQIKKSYLQQFKKLSKKQARDVQNILKKMVAYFNHSVGSIAYHFVNAYLEKVFHSIDIRFQDKQKLRQDLTKQAIVYLPNHRSHIDYFLLSYALYKNSFAPPHIAAGINLSFFPIGPLLNSMGGFFIRRKIGRNKHYAFLLKKYIEYLVHEKVPQAAFIEGGRTRSGKLLKARMGLLNYQVQSLKADATLKFVPVFINYDFTPELRDVCRLLQGTHKQKESFWQLLKSLPKVLKPLGKVQIIFQEAISADQNKANVETLAQDIMFQLGQGIKNNSNFVFAHCALTSLKHQTFLNYSLDTHTLKESYQKTSKHLKLLDKAQYPPKHKNTSLERFEQLLQSCHDQNLCVTSDTNQITLQKESLALLFHIRQTGMHLVLQSLIDHTDIEKKPQLCPLLNILLNMYPAGSDSARSLYMAQKANLQNTQKPDIAFSKNAELSLKILEPEIKYIHFLSSQGKQNQSIQYSSLDKVFFKYFQADKSFSLKSMDTDQKMSNLQQLLETILKILEN